MGVVKRRAGWRKTTAARAGAGVVALLGLTGVVALLRRGREPQHGEDVEWIDNLSIDVETRLLEAAESVELRIGSLQEVPPRQRAEVDAVLDRARSRISEACGNLLFKLGGPPDPPADTSPS